MNVKITWVMVPTIFSFLGMLIAIGASLLSIPQMKANEANMQNEITSLKIQSSVTNQQFNDIQQRLTRIENKLDTK